MRGGHIVATICLALAVLCVAASRGHSYWQSRLQVSIVTVAPSSGKILLADGASFILQTDGTSKVCRAGGC